MDRARSPSIRLTRVERIDRRRLKPGGEAGGDGYGEGSRCANNGPGSATGFLSPAISQKEHDNRPCSTYSV